MLQRTWHQRCCNRRPHQRCRPGRAGVGAARGDLRRATDSAVGPGHRQAPAAANQRRRSDNPAPSPNKAAGPSRSTPGTLASANAPNAPLPNSRISEPSRAEASRPPPSTVGQGSVKKAARTACPTVLQLCSRSFRLFTLHVMAPYHPHIKWQVVDRCVKVSTLTKNP